MNYKQLKGFLNIGATESGVSLATRALLRASIYTTTGFGLFCLIVWKSMGVKDVSKC